MVLINDMVKKNYYDDDKFSCVISDLLYESNAIAIDDDDNDYDY